MQQLWPSCRTKSLNHESEAAFLQHWGREEGKSLRYSQNHRLRTFKFLAFPRVSFRSRLLLLLALDRLAEHFKSVLAITCLGFELASPQINRATSTIACMMGYVASMQLMLGRFFGLLRMWSLPRHTSLEQSRSRLGL
jgi:hypothetical protein